MNKYRWFMNKYTLRRYLLFFVSLFINAFGIVFITKALLGTSPITSVTYVLSLCTPFTMGQWTIILNLLFLLFELPFMTRENFKEAKRMYFLQIPITLFFGLSIDLSMGILSWLNPGHYAMQLASLAVGCVILAAGIALEVKANIALVAGEFFVGAISRRIGKEFGFVKLGFDITLVVLACALSLAFMGTIDGVREGTVIAAIVVGPIVHFISPAYKVLDSWISPRAGASGAESPSPADGGRRVVVTVAREYGSGGRQLGQLIAKRLGVKCYDKEIIELAARKSGLTERYVSANEQSVSPLWIKNLLLQNYESSLEHSLSSKDALFVAEYHVIRDIAAKGSCVIVGRCADYVLDDFPGVVRVFCYSDTDNEVRRCVEKYGVPQDKAADEVRRINRAREAHYEYYTGRKWRDVHNYDLVVNTASMSIGTACSLVEALAKR